jgi:hypothetical protein
MNAVKYAEQVIGFNASDFRDVVITKSNSNNLGSAIALVKESLARGLVVGIGISMPAGSVWGQKIQGTKFVGHMKPFQLEGGHAMVITDFKHQGGTFGKAPDVEAEVKKDIEPGLQFRLKNSWGSQSGYNEFGKAIQTGFYDMDLTYMTDVLQSNGFIIFTLIK